MAETKRKAAKAKPKKARKTAAKKAPVTKAVKKAAPAKAKRPAAKARAFQPRSTSFNIAELIDHPLVADLLAVGALAAVGAIADHSVRKRTGDGKAGSSKALKAAGKAAAAAVGKRLMTEVDAIKQASKAKGPTRGSR